MPRDVVCGMEVPGSDWCVEYDGIQYCFCSDGCRQVFLKDPARCLAGASRGDYDLVIIGGGPAGLTAGVYASLQHLSALLLTADLGGQAVDTRAIKNYMGFDLVSGPELIDRFRQQLLQGHYLEHRLDEVVRVERNGTWFTLSTRSGGACRARAVIVATGTYRRRLDVPGEQQLLRRGVSYHLAQDVGRFAGHTIAVVGGGNAGLRATQELHRVGASVILVSFGPLTGDAAEVERARALSHTRVLVDHEVVAIEGHDRVEGLRVRSRAKGHEQLLPVEAVFIEIGFLPNVDCVAHLVERNPQGEILVDCDGQTNVAGLFAAGDVIESPGKRIIIAAGDGARAALAAGRHVRRLRERGGRDTERTARSQTGSRSTRGAPGSAKGDHL